MIHRLHHQHADRRPDPHSPLVSWFWGHVGWLLVENRHLSQLATYERYARDILQDPFYLRLERGHLWVWVYVAHAFLFYLAGLAVGWATTGMDTDAGRLVRAADVALYRSKQAGRDQATGSGA